MLWLNSKHIEEAIDQKKNLQEIITSGKTKKRKTNIIFKHTKLAAKVIMNCATAVLIDLRQT